MSRISFQFPALLAEQVRFHAARLDRSVGWILTTAWRLAEPQNRTKNQPFSTPTTTPLVPVGTPRPRDSMKRRALTVSPMARSTCRRPT